MRGSEKKKVLNMFFWQKKITRFIEISILMLVVLTLSCSESVIFTDVHLRLDTLKEVYPKEFESNSPKFLENQNLYKAELESEDHLLAHYGTDIALEAWDCEKAGLSQTNWKKIKDFLMQEKLKSYNVTKTKEMRFDYKKQDGISGILWTNKQYLFLAEASGNENLRKFLSLSSIAKIK